MEVAEQIVVLNDGRIEQVGSPRELYERPANEFVMTFLGPATRLGGELIRPHDVELFAAPEPGAVEGQVVRVLSLGFEVRVDVDTPDGQTWVQVTRGEAARLAVAEGHTVFLKAAAPSADEAARARAVMQ